jgi:hypothetical protein
MYTKKQKLDLLRLSHYIISDLVSLQSIASFHISPFEDDFPHIIAGDRKIEFDKNDAVIYYGYALNWHPYGKFDMFDTSAILRYLLEPDSVPPVLISDVFEIVSALTKKCIGFTVSWENSDHPEVRSDSSRVVFSLGNPRSIHYFDGAENFGAVETAQAIKFFIEAAKRRKK